MRLIVGAHPSTSSFESLYASTRSNRSWTGAGRGACKTPPPRLDAVGWLPLLLRCSASACTFESEVPESCAIRSCRLSLTSELPAASVASPTASVRSGRAVRFFGMLVSSVCARFLLHIASQSGSSMPKSSSASSSSSTCAGASSSSGASSSKLLRATISSPSSSSS